MSSEWLYQCARTGVKVPEAPYVLTQKQSAGVKQNHTGIEKAGKGQEGQLDDMKSAFNKFTVPESRDGKEDEGRVEDHEKTRGKTEAPMSKEITKGVLFSMRLIWKI